MAAKGPAKGDREKTLDDALLRVVSNFENVHDLSKQQSAAIKLEIADGSSVFKVDPVGLFRLCLLLKHSSSNFNTVDFLSKDSTRLKQDLQIQQDCLSTSIVWRINWEIFSARPSWVSKLWVLPSSYKFIPQHRQHESCSLFTCPFLIPILVGV